jgi:hypothetical protein
MNAWLVVRRRRVAAGDCRMDGLANAFGIGGVRNRYWLDIAMESQVHGTQRWNDDFALSEVQMEAHGAPSIQKLRDRSPVYLLLLECLLWQGRK